eukprot:2411107-Amphidinium_carterae.1
MACLPSQTRSCNLTRPSRRTIAFSSEASKQSSNKQASKQCLEWGSGSLLGWRVVVESSRVSRSKPAHKKKMTT